MKEQMIQEQLQRSLKLAGVQQKPLEESFLLGAAIIAGVTIGFGKVTKARRDRVINALTGEFQKKVLPQFDKSIKNIERLIKVFAVTSTPKTVMAEYEKILSEIDSLSAYVQKAKKDLPRLDIDKVISDEVNQQLFLKWGDRFQTEIRGILNKEIDQIIQDLERSKENIKQTLESKLDGLLSDPEFAKRGQNPMNVDIRMNSN